MTGTSAASAVLIKKLWSCATLTNVSKFSGCATNDLGLVAPSIETLTLYNPPFSKIGPSISGRPSPLANNPPAVPCTSP